MEVKYIRYQDRKWVVLKEFITGNGTYDMVMYEATDGNEILIIPDLDVQQEVTE